MAVFDPGLIVSSIHEDIATRTELALLNDQYTSFFLV